MVSGDTPLGVGFHRDALKKLSEIDGGAVLTVPEGHDTSAGKTPRKAKTTASQKSRDLKGIILGTENQPLSFSMSHLRKSL
jgi:hypothetical protein